MLLQVMLCLKQRDERRTKEYSVTYQDVKSKEGENVMRKPIEMLTVTQQEDSRSKNETLLTVDKFTWKTRREGEMNKNVTLMPIDEFIWRTQREDDMNKIETLQLADKFVWKIQSEEKENRKETLQLIKWPVWILLRECLSSKLINKDEERLEQIHNTVQ